MIVIMFDIFKTGTLKTLRDKLFGALAIFTVLAIASDIISSYAMNNPTRLSWAFTEYSLIIYFILTPLLSMLWHMYATSVVYKPTKKRNLAFKITTIPYILYVLICLSNPLTNWMFSLAGDNTYGRGVLFNILYILFYGYSVATIILACCNYKKTERTTSIVLTIFPIITGVSVVLQETLKGYLIFGAAFTLVLLITYLFLQNRKATRDSLTGIDNRNSFSSTIERLSLSNEHGFILIVALDDFKLFNQTFGQKNGDKLLCTVSEYLISISPNRTAYRYGGDIFTLILKKATEKEASDLAHLVLDRFEQPFIVDGANYSASVCLGVVEYPGKSLDKNQSIISALDFALYQAKRRGKGQLAFFNEELVRKFKRKNEISEAIKRAIENKSFEVYLQPIYHTELKRFAFAEALLRLNDEKLGSISPAEFIPVAEESGQIVGITYFVLEKVCEFLKSNEDVLKNNISISVNFSIVQFMQNNMVEKIKSIIESYNVKPNLIKIEITESVIADSLSDIKLAMEQLNDFGINFALDDYGQGYSNISYLINLPFTFVKLDKSIIDNIVKDNIVISALIPMFKRLKKIIISEGVEQKEQADILCELSCDAIQGYYYARPMPMNQAINLFK
ncbi:MAG: bifunctional diguanylate cyclase/phosphodiesterase [Clostridia bacterium]